MNIGTLQAYLGLETAEFDRKLGISLKSIEDAGKKMRNIGKKMSMAITAPLVGLGVASFKVFKDFEAEISKIVGLVGVAKEQTDEWSDSILTMSVSVGKGPKELAEALFFITSAGIKGAAAMDVLEMSAKGAAAGLGETKVVADLVTSAMNAYGVNNLSATKATDILVAAVREGKAEADSLAQSMGGVLPIASAMGVRFDEVGAAIAAMTRTGTDAAMASTSLRGILAAIYKPTKQAEEALQQMSTSSAELRKSLQEKGLFQTLQKLSQLQKQYGDEVLGQVIPNIRALSGVLDLMGSNVADTEKIFTALTDTTGTLDKAFQAASETTEFKWQQSIVRSQKALAQLGKSVQKAFIPILNAISKVVEWLGNKFDGLSDTMKTVVLVVTTVVASIGPFLLGLGTIIKIAPTVVTALTAVRGAVVKLNAAILTNPYLLAGAAIIAIVVGLYAWSKSGKEVETVQNRLNKSIENTRGSILSEQASMNELFTQIKKTNTGTKERKLYIDTLNQQYGQYLPNLLTEKSTLEDIEKAQSFANDELAKSIILKSKQADLERELTPVFKAQGQALQDLRDMWISTGKGEEEVETRLKAMVTRFRQSRGTFLDMSNAFYAVFGSDMMGDKWLDDYGDYSWIIGDLSASFVQQKNIIEEVEDAYATLLGSMKSVGGTIIDPETPTGGGADTLTEQIAELQSQIKKVNADYELTKDLLTDENALQQAKIKYLTDIFELNKQIYLLNPTEAGLEALKEEWAILQKTESTTKNKLALAEHLDFINEKAIERSKAIKEAEQGINEEYKLSLYLAKDKKAELQAEYDKLSSIYQLKKQLAAEDKVFSEEELAALKLINDQLTAQKLILDTMKDDSTPQTWAEKWSSAAEQVESAINQAMETVIDGIINAISSVEEVDIGQFLMNTLAELAIRVGKIAVITAAAVEGIKKALQSLNPYAALAAGIALIALGIAVKASLANSVQGLATGGRVTKSGAFMVGEEGPELVTLNAGSAVTPNHLLGNTGGGEPYILSTRISGRDLEVIMERAKAQNKRRGK